MDKHNEGKITAGEDVGVKKPQARSAYILYCNAHREEIKKQNPSRLRRRRSCVDITPKEMITKLAEAWKTASEKEKKKYNEEAKKEKEAVEKKIQEMKEQGVVFKVKAKKTVVTEETIFNSAEWLYVEEKLDEYQRKHDGWRSKRG